MSSRKIIHRSPVLRAGDGTIERINEALGDKVQTVRVDMHGNIIVTLKDDKDAVELTSLLTTLEEEKKR